MPLARPAPTLGDYREHLCLLRPWLASIAHAAGRHGDGPQDPRLLPQLDRLPPIDADLADLANLDDVSGCAVRSTLTRAVFPGLDGGAPWRWGVAYVAEGSQLGGAVLYRRLAASLAPHPLRYLQGEGPPGPRWQQFLSRLRAEVSAGADIAQACAGACAAFDALIAHLPQQARQEEAA
jgi:heme oxygenase